MKRYGLPTLYLLVVFGCGLATGVFGNRMYEQKTVQASQPPQRPSPEEWKKRHIAELQKRLNLTPDQATRISAALDDTHAEMMALMAKSQPDMERIQKEQYDKVTAVLTPAQAAEYAKFHAERERRRMQGRPPQ
jgi:Spy/CpxP family protein refolding chaperone